jgi:hypothetical protein
MLNPNKMIPNLLLYIIIGFIQTLPLSKVNEQKNSEDARIIKKLRNRLPLKTNPSQQNHDFYRLAHRKPFASAVPKAPSEG